MYRHTPGEARRVVAEKVLVLAPHYDDEVLGCGGLLASLSPSSSIDVQFLTDGSGGEEDVEDRDAYASLRRRESEAALAVLGARGRYAGFPDGQLEYRHDELASAIRDALQDVGPDLLLVPSPLEVTADHRAVFFALHALLSPVRPGDALEEVVRGLRVLVYEINHPAYPDLLVDVSDHVETIREAMSCYDSQQARHDYLAAGLGLRRYRTHTLEPEVKAAEGYSDLALDDFVTRSASQLVEFLGGVAPKREIASGPVVSIVVRTKDRPELLREALDSLAASHYRPLEVVLVNDGGISATVPSDYPLAVVAVDLPENRGRAAAANAGVAASSGELVGFLDDDDLAAPEHVATLVAAVTAADVQVAYSDAAVGIYELGGAEGWVCRGRRLPYSRDFDPDLLLVDNYIPFNTLLVRRSLFEEAGSFDEDLAFFEDWDFLIRLSRLVPFHHLRQVTCEYRHFLGSGHHVLAGTHDLRSGAVDEFLVTKARVIGKHQELLTPDRVAGVVDRLRGELVGLGEEVRDLRRIRSDLEADRGRLEIDRRSLEDRYHRLNGEVVSLRSEMATLGADKERVEAQRDLADVEMQRLYDEERRLYDEERRLREDLEARDASVKEQTEHLGRTYAEIERLGDVVRRMEASRAWRLHQFWQRTFRSS